MFQLSAVLIGFNCSESFNNWLLIAKLKLDPPSRISLGGLTFLSKLSIFSFPNICEVDARGVEGSRIPNNNRAAKIKVKNERFLMKDFIP